MSYQGRNPNGQATMGNSAPVVIASDQTSIPISVGQKVQATAAFTRPANTTAYSIGDVVSDSTSSTTMMTLSNVVSVNGGSGYIVALALSTDLKSITPRIRVHFYTVNTPTLSADNAAHQEKYADIGKKVGHYDIASLVTPSDTTNSTVSRMFDGSARIPFVCDGSSKNLYAIFETLDAFTPASGQNFSLTITVEK